MSTNLAATGIRCLFFGMPCAFSTIILDALRATDLELVGIVTPDRSTASARQITMPRPFLALHPRSDQVLDTTPRFAVRSLRSPAVQEALLATSPDLIVVACFPWLLPPDIRRSAAIAAINVHPSLLPRWRGPDPLFWTFHAGDTATGVTIHLLDHGFDTGPILDQRTIPITDGESLADRDHRLATLGGSMLSDLAQSLPTLPATRPQDESRATAAPVPDDSARVIDATWTVDRALRFIAGVSASHGPLFYRRSDGTVCPVPSPRDRNPTAEIALADGRLSVSLGSVK